MKILYLFYLLKDFGSRSRRLCQFTHFKTQARLFRKHDISPMNDIADTYSKHAIHTPVPNNNSWHFQSAHPYEEFC